MANINKNVHVAVSASSYGYLNISQAQADIVSGFHKAVICLIRNLEVLSSKLGREPVILRGFFFCSSSQSG